MVELKQKIRELEEKLEKEKREKQFWLGLTLFEKFVKIKLVTENVSQF